jgi:hypothetical protein
MKTKDIFSLAIRLLGLFFIYLAARSVPVIWNSSGQALISAVLVVGVFTAVAWWLLGGAPLLMQRAYPDTAKDEKTEAAPIGDKADA